MESGKRRVESGEAGFVYFSISSFHRIFPPLYTSCPHGEKQQGGDESNTPATTAGRLAHDGPAAHRHRQQRQRRRDQVRAGRHCQEIPPRPVLHAVAPAPDRPPRPRLYVRGARALVCGVLAACEL